MLLLCNGVLNMFDEQVLGLPPKIHFFPMKRVFLLVFPQRNELQVFIIVPYCKYNNRVFSVLCENREDEAVVHWVRCTITDRQFCLLLSKRHDLFNRSIFLH